MRAEKLPDKCHIKFGLKKKGGNGAYSGGKLYYWLKRNPKLKIKYISHVRISDDSKINILPDSVKNNYDYDFGFEFMEDIILHYRAGSNWNKWSKEKVDKK